MKGLTGSSTLPELRCGGRGYVYGSGDGGAPSRCILCSAEGERALYP